MLFRSGANPTSSPGGTSSTSGTSAPSNLSGKNPRVLNYSELVSLAKGAGFNQEQAVTMAAIAMGESSGRTNAHNPNAKTGDNSYGLWQINMLGRMGPERRRMFNIQSDEDLWDPAVNAKAAYKLYQMQGFGAWSVYKSGAYRQFLTGAQQASGAPAAQSSPGGAAPPPTQQQSAPTPSAQPSVSAPGTLNTAPGVGAPPASMKERERTPEGQRHPPAATPAPTAQSGQESKPEAQTPASGTTQDAVAFLQSRQGGGSGFTGVNASKLNPTFEIGRAHV